MEDRRTRLKYMILQGKSQGYLTVAEVRAHLPSDMRDAEQIEGIIGMIREMNIRVYDEAPKPETFLVSDVSLESLKANLLVAANDSLANEDPNKNE